MKTTISIPDRVYKSAKQLAKRSRVSRNELYCKALRAFVDAHQDKGVTERLNSIYDTEKNDSALDAEIASLQSRAIVRNK